MPKRKLQDIDHSTTTSEVLRSILKTNEKNYDEHAEYESFFKDIFQKQPNVFRRHQDNQGLVNNMDVDEICNFLETCRLLFSSCCRVSKLHDIHTPGNGNHKSSILFAERKIDPPLIMKDQTPLQYDEIQNRYNCNLFAAFLDGCSIIMNHAELVNEPFFLLCQNLQKSFQHVYINTYLTPPQSKAVEAHADDRDVFVIQLFGSKTWKVYEEVPIKYPFANEQVGKGELKVPDSVFRSKLTVDTVLNQGDVLYIPRGFVHEAECTSQGKNQPSFHATVALATHDWSTGKIISDIIQTSITTPKFRMALSPTLLKSSSPEDSCQFQNLEKEVDEILSIVKEKITASAVMEICKTKASLHNENSFRLYSEVNTYLKELSLTNVQSSSPSPIVGPHASLLFKPSSKIKIRSSTPEERNSVPPTFDVDGQIRKSGLSIANDNLCDTLLSLLGFVKDHQNDSFELLHLQDKFRKARGQEEQGENQECDELSLVSFVKCCIELGAMALVEHSN